MANLGAIVFEFHESVDRIGVAAIVGELERMHDVASAGAVRCWRCRSVMPTPGWRNWQTRGA